MKEFIAALFFSLALFVGLSHASHRLSADGGGAAPAPNYRLFYEYQGVRTYTSYYSGGTFQCGGSPYVYGVAIWHGGSGSGMYVSDICQEALEHLTITCSGQECARVSLRSDDGSLGCVGYQYPNPSNNYINGYWILWGNSTGAYPSDQYIDFDNDGYTFNSNPNFPGGDCGWCDSSKYPGAIDYCGDGIDQDCNQNEAGCITPFTPVTGFGTNGTSFGISGTMLNRGQSGGSYKGYGGYGRKINEQ